MPAVYAHDRFGQDVIAEIDGTAKEMIETNRLAFDIGLQGPDILFYYRPYLPNPVKKIGSILHGYTGRRYYGNLTAWQEEYGDDISFTYLLGSVCHFTLDSLCHPLIDAREAKGDVLHEDIEAAFDRALLVADGLDPETTVLGAGLTGDEVPEVAESISIFYPRVTVRQLTEGIRSVYGLQKILTTPTPAKRRFLTGVLGAAGSKGRSLSAHILPQTQPPELEECIGQLADLYDEALALAPEMLSAVIEGCYGNRKFPAAFDKTFSG